MSHSFDVFQWLSSWVGNAGGSVLSGPEATWLTAFVLALLHSLWQGALWGVLLWVVLWALPARLMNLRYAVSVSVLLGVLITFLGTWSLLQHESATAMATPEEIISAPFQQSLTAEPSVADGHGAHHVDHVASLPAARQAEFVPASPLASATGPAFLDWAAPWLAVLWCCGASWMLIRGISSLIAVRGLLAATPNADPRLQTLLSQVAHNLGVRAPVRLLLTTSLPTPAIWGLTRPVLFLPLSLATTLTDSELEAIFAHELAHVRRYDVVVNLLQLVLEAAFFFNPAVWWISRQVRIEREACCDGLAARLTAGPVRYAELLARLVDQLRPAPVPLAAMAGDGGSLLDRVRRLLLPGYRPVLQLSWWTCGLLLLFTGAALYGLYQGTDLAVQLLTDEERVELVAQQAEKLATELVHQPKFTQMTISGRVQFSPEVPEPPPIQVHSNVRRENSSTGSSENPLGGTNEFSYTFENGTVYLCFTAKGFAPSILGPFTPQEGATFQDQVVTMTPGRSVNLEVVDEDGHPAAGVNVSAFAQMDGSGSGVFGDLVTNEQGLVTIDHASESIPMSFWLKGSGYQETNIGIQPLPVGDTPLRLHVKRAIPASGVVTNAAGEPVAGVELRTIVEYTGGPRGSTHHRGGWEDPLAVTDAEGKFTLTQLKDGTEYALVLNHPNYGPALLEGVSAGKTDLAAVLPVPWTVHGKYTGDMQALGDRRTVVWTQVFTGRKERFHRLEARQPVRQDLKLDDHGDFTINNVAPGGILVFINQQTQAFEITEDQQLIAVTTKTEPVAEYRDVILSFVQQGKPVQPRGSLKIQGALRDHRDFGQFRLPVENGEIRCTVKVGTSLHLWEEAGLLGFWFSLGDVEWPDTIPAGTEPLRIQIPCYPAGSITGQVLLPNGEPAKQFQISLNCEFIVSARQHFKGENQTYTTNNLNNRTDDQGRFLITPVPLGGTCRVTTGTGYAKLASEKLVLTARKPTETVNLTWGELTELQARILDESGNPVAGLPLELSLQADGINNSWGSGMMSDRNGLVTFSQCGAWHPNAYKVTVSNTPGYVPRKYPLRAGGITEIRVEKGKLVQGLVLDEQGKPVPGVEVYAMLDSSVQRPPEDLDMAMWTDADAVTDEAGRFQFTTLPAFPCKLNTRGVNLNAEKKILPGKDNNITLQGQVADWFRKRLEQGTR